MKWNSMSSHMCFNSFRNAYKNSQYSMIEKIAKHVCRMNLFIIIVSIMLNFFFFGKQAEFMVLGYIYILSLL